MSENLDVRPLPYLRAALVLALSAVPVFAQPASISSIEINQAIGKQLNGDAYFVAGKATAIRAFLASDVTVDPTQTNAVIQRGGQTIATLPPQNYSTPVHVVDFLCPSMDACGGWAAGSYVFQVTVNGVTLSTQGTTYSFVVRKKLHVLARPVKATFSGTVVSVPNDSWKTMWTFTRSVYPIADDGITWDTAGEFDASSIDLDTNTGQLAVWQALTDSQPKECSVNPKAAGCYDLIVGFIGQNPKNPNGGYLAGFTCGRPTNIVVETDPDAAATVAHEIAHTMAIGDTYDGGSLHCSVNPAPDGFKGSDWDTGAPTSCTAGRQAYPTISATLIPAATTDPYEVNGRGPLPDMACYMGSSGQTQNFWTTPDTYDWLFKQLAPPTPSSTPSLRRPFATATPVQAVEFSGTVNAAGTVQFNPWQSFLPEETITVNTGAYSVRAVDASGNILASQGFDVAFVALTDPPTTITWAPFEGAMLFPDGTAKFQILKGTTVLAELPVSKNAPVVSGVTPTQTGQTLVAGNTISWAGTDADGDKLTYTVEYNPNPSDTNSEWQMMADNITATSLNYDFSTLAGGTSAAIMVTASDGVRSGSAQSAAFAVPFKAPQVVIDPPAGGSNYETGDEILLTGEATDPQDDILEGASLVWSSNISGKLGTGDELDVTLPAGQHTITLTATNSGGVSASASVVVRVGAKTTAFGETPATAAIVASDTFGSLATSAQLPAGALSNPAEVTIEMTAAPANATPPAGLFFAGQSFNLTIQQEAQEDQWTAVTSIPQGVLVTVAYNAPGDASTLKLFRWNSAATAWVDAATDCQPASTYDRSTAGKIAVKVCTMGSFALAGNMQPAAAQVVNGASYVSTAVSPGAFITIFGSNLATVMATGGIPLPNTLGGVTVTINGSLKAPLYYVSPSQINFQLPYETPLGAATATIARGDNVTGPAISFTVNAAGPGILQWGNGRAVAVDFDTAGLNSGSNPTKAGRYITVYVTGVGPLDNPVATGQPAPSSPLSKATSVVTATIGGIPATVIWAGLSPNWVGLGQVNIVVPAAPAGDQPLIITVGTYASNSALVTVQP
jgi:uncharacterized protein (TIGR03437 family)